MPPVRAPTRAYLRKLQRLGEAAEGGGGRGGEAEAALVQRNRFDANEIARDRRIPKDIVVMFVSGDEERKGSSRVLVLGFAETEPTSVMPCLATSYSIISYFVS